MRLTDVARVDVLKPWPDRPALVVLGVLTGVVAGVLVARTVKNDNGWTDPRIALPLYGLPVAGGVLMGRLSKRILIAEPLTCGPPR